MPRKVPYLETSPEKFQQPDGNGSCNSDSPTPTGNRLPAILRTSTGSSSPTDSQSKQPLDDTSGKETGLSGSSGGTSFDLEQFWVKRREVPPKW